MPILASEGARKEFHLLPADTYQAVCNDIWDIGFQKTVFNDEEKIQHKIIIQWEVTEKIPSGEYEGKRFAISKRYTLSLHKKSTLRAHLEAWRGKAFTDEELKGFDIEKLIGVNCMVSVIHNESGANTYANVSGVSKLMKGLTPIKPENERKIPDWVKKLQDNAVENPYHNEQTETAEVSEVADEPLPF